MFVGSSVEAEANPSQSLDITRPLMLILKPKVRKSKRTDLPPARPRPRQEIVFLAGLRKTTKDSPGEGRKTRESIVTGVTLAWTIRVAEAKRTTGTHRM